MQGQKVVRYISSTSGTNFTNLGLHLNAMLIVLPAFGEMAEWSNAPVLKTGMGL